MIAERRESLEKVEEGKGTEEDEKKELLVIHALSKKEEEKDPYDTSQQEKQISSSLTKLPFRTLITTFNHHHSPSST
jgi:hypothetical protein